MKYRQYLCDKKWAAHINTHTHHSIVYGIKSSSGCWFSSVEFMNGPSFMTLFAARASHEFNLSTHFNLIDNEMACDVLVALIPIPKIEIEIQVIVRAGVCCESFSKFSILNIEHKTKCRVAIIWNDISYVFGKIVKTFCSLHNSRWENWMACILQNHKQMFWCISMYTHL